MGHRHRLTPGVVLLGLGLGLGLAACKRTPPAPNDAGPPDRLAPLELPEGPDKAYGLAFPRGAKVNFRSERMTTASTRDEAEKIANFVQKRVSDGRVIRGASGTTFDDVVLKEDPKRHLSVEIKSVRAGWGTEIIVNDVTPVFVDPSVSEAERWRRVGLTPDGKQIDRNKLQ